MRGYDRGTPCFPNFYFSRCLVKVSALDHECTEVLLHVHNELSVNKVKSEIKIGRNKIYFEDHVPKSGGLAGRETMDDLVSSLMEDLRGNLSVTPISEYDSPGGIGGSPLDLFPWDRLSPFEQEAVTAGSFGSLEAALMDEVEQMTKLVDTVLLEKTCSPQMSLEAGPEFELNLMASLEKNRKMQDTLRMITVDLEQASAETRQSLALVRHLQKKLVSTANQTKRATSQRQIINGIVKSSFIDGEAAGNQADAELLSRYNGVVFKKNPKWSQKEMSLLVDGVRQANKRLLLENVLQQSAGKGEEEVKGELKEIQLMPLGDLEENIIGLDWDSISNTFFNGSRGSKECQIQWTLHQHPMINLADHWSNDELARLKKLIEKYGTAGKWTEIANDLGTNRTAWQCLQTYQRRMRKDLLKGRWSPAEDSQLMRLVKENIFGPDTGSLDCNWPSVASSMEDRTVVQCVHRFFKTLDPSIIRGRWTSQEDALLRLAVGLHGCKDWFLVCRWVPGRTDVQCRERWMNVLHPGLVTDPFTPEEDQLLVKVVQEAGRPGQWASIQQKHFPGRTDSQLRRRWQHLDEKKNSVDSKEETGKPDRKRKTAEAPKKRGRKRKMSIK